MLVGICDPPVMLFFVFVLFRVGSGVAALPESFNEVVALFVVGKLFEGGPFLVGDNPDHVLVQPFLVSLAELNVQRPFLRLLLLLIRLALEWIHVIRGLRLRTGHRRAGRWCGRGWSWSAGSSRRGALGSGCTRQACGDGQQRKRS